MTAPLWSDERLAAFFRDEAPEWGARGDAEGWTPVRTAIEMLRECKGERENLLRAAREINARPRERTLEEMGVINAPVPYPDSLRDMALSVYALCNVASEGKGDSVTALLNLHAASYIIGEMYERSKKYRRWKPPVILPEDEPFGEGVK